MDIKINQKSYFVFDLDDTLYAEIEYLKSAYRVIANQLFPVIKQDIYDVMLSKYYSNINVFLWVQDTFSNLLSLEYLLMIYRNHYPNIHLKEDANRFLYRLKSENIRMGLITDGRSVTQRNKIKALGLSDYFNDIIISEEFGSEKPCINNYKYFSDKYPEADFFFFGDNTTKDFQSSVVLKWKTFCMKDTGNNIHKQDIEYMNKTMSGIHVLKTFDEIKFKINHE